MDALLTELMQNACAAYGMDKEALSAGGTVKGIGKGLSWLLGKAKNIGRGAPKTVPAAKPIPNAGRGIVPASPAYTPYTMVDDAAKNLPDAPMTTAYLNFMRDGTVKAGPGRLGAGAAAGAAGKPGFFRKHPYATIAGGTAIGAGGGGYYMGSGGEPQAKPVTKPSVPARGDDTVALATEKPWYEGMMDTQNPQWWDNYGKYGAYGVGGLLSAMLLSRLMGGGGGD